MNPFEPPAQQAKDKKAPWTTHQLRMAGRIVFSVFVFGPVILAIMAGLFLLFINTIFELL